MGEQQANAPAQQPEPGDVVNVSVAEIVKLRERDQAFGALESSVKGYVVGSTLSTALANRTDLVPGAASKILKDVRDRFDARRQGDDWAVASKDGKGVDDALAAYLAEPDNAMFLRATNRGGVASNGATSAPTQMNGGATDATDARRARLAAEMIGSGVGFGGFRRSRV